MRDHGPGQIIANLLFLGVGRGGTRCRARAIIVGTGRGWIIAERERCCPGRVLQGGWAGLTVPSKPRSSSRRCATFTGEGISALPRFGRRTGLVNATITVLMCEPQAAHAMRQFASVPCIEVGGANCWHVTSNSGSSTQTCRNDALCFIQSIHAMMLTLADRLDIDVD
jgi:hypothetical protein